MRNKNTMATNTKKQKSSAPKRGKLIVIDGSDGSGKATQVALLAKRLKAVKVPIKTIDFPRYYDNFFGQLLGEALSGAHGDFIGVNPRIASVLYAADRFESSKTIEKWLNEGYIVLADRYVSANQIHQGGKVSDPVKRKEFLDWLDTMEHKVFAIPRPDLTIFLDVPFEVSKQWLEKKFLARKKKYLKGRRDVAEDNLMYLKNSREAAIGLAQGRKNWDKVECCTNMVCMPVEAVHERVFEIVKKKFNIKMK